MNFIIKNFCLNFLDHKWNICEVTVTSAYSSEIFTIVYLSVTKHSCRVFYQQILQERSVKRDAAVKFLQAMFTAMKSSQLIGFPSQRIGHFYKNLQKILYALFTVVNISLLIHFLIPFHGI